MINLNKIKALSKEKGWTLSFLSKKLSLSQSYFTDVKNGKTSISENRLAIIAELLDTTKEYLKDETELKERHSTASNLFGQIVTLRVLSSVSAGYDSEIVEEWNDERDSVPLTMLHGYPPEECCLLVVKGDSMYPKILDGDKIIIHVQSSVDSGDTAVVIYNGNEGTVKKVKYVNGEDWMELIPANPEYPIKHIEGSDLTKCLVFGKVIGLYRSI